jgi:hypothetical protein
MLDFLTISTKCPKSGIVEIYPKFIVGKSNDLMIRGGDFYAIWDEEQKLWITEESEAIRLIDNETTTYYKNFQKRDPDDKVHPLYLWDSDTGMIDKWHKYVQKQMPESYHQLDEKLIFKNTEVRKRDYASKRLNYALEEGDFSAYDELMSTLYSPEERKKIEWAIGAIVSGDSKQIQKFLVLYGSAGTGKSTVLNIIQDLFDGYYSVFDAKALGSLNGTFALEAFKSNPLVAIQHDGDLSRIEDNTRINSIVSHEVMTVNEKFKSTYSSKFNCFLFMGTNKPVRITDAKSGIIRRLIDVSPSGNTVPRKRYEELKSQIKFELGGIAWHCLSVYENDPSAYDDYIPIEMLGASNDFYNFVLDSYEIFKQNDGTTLKAAWEMYKQYCDDAKVPYPVQLRTFKMELRNYFREFRERDRDDNGQYVRNIYSGFIKDKFISDIRPSDDINEPTIIFREEKSIFDSEYYDYPAQYATSEGTPLKKWDNVTTTLADIDTSKLHYVRVPENHIVIDFDLKDKNGKKSFEKNLEAASKWPTTYAELSKSGAGIHLHYIYDGDVSKLSRIYDEDIEIKVFTGNSSLRRLLTKCSNNPIRTIKTGLPLKGEKPVVNFDGIANEKSIRTMIKRNLNKEYHDSTKCSIDFIKKILDDAYASGIGYDVTDMRPAILDFASNSTHQASYCIKALNDMHFCSEQPNEQVEEYEPNDDFVFFDLEVMKNLFVVCWKMRGENHKTVKMINPTPTDIEPLLKYKLIGFNNRRYDNHILYARLIGYNNEELFDLSQRIINGSPNCMFGEAYNLSYADIYDFASAGNKKSLKKFEIELGIHHQELGLPWDQPVDEKLWETVADYCVNDVIATEAVFEHLHADWKARLILADIADMNPNTTTNTLTTKIIFGSEKHPKLVYTDFTTGKQFCQGVEIPVDTSFINVFPGYNYDKYTGRNMYNGVDVSKGGYVYAEPGMYGNVALLDVASLHPHSAIALNAFGEYTQRFKDLVDARVAIKHHDYDSVRKMFNGKLAKYLESDEDADMLSSALKTPINSVYGLTSASFENPFRDPANVNNIVALRGALFMATLQAEVQQRGFTVAHIKTDSIKIPDATPEIIDFCMNFATKYGYQFEHEATYERMCLVNDAVYIARYATVDQCNALYGDKYIAQSKDICKKNKKHPGEWTATGAQFAQPYVFKTLFSREKIEFDDMKEVKTVQTALYLDMNEQLEDVSDLEKQQEKLYQRLKKPKAGDNEQEILAEIAKLCDKIAVGHNYRFVGKAGAFCPVKPGCGGGILLREKDGKYTSANGTIGYRWLEAEEVKLLGKEKDIDRSYYDHLVNDAIIDISELGDAEWFRSDDPYLGKNNPEQQKLMTPVPF